MYKLDSSKLKVIALMSMVMDHVAKGLLIPMGSTNTILQGMTSVFLHLGRISFPIYLFLVMESFFKTKNTGRFIVRLLLGALIAEVPFDLVFYGSWWYPAHQNVMFTFLYLVVMYTLIDLVSIYFIVHLGGTPLLRYLVFFPIIVGISIPFISYLGVDYTVDALALSLIYYIGYHCRVYSKLVKFIEQALGYMIFMVNPSSIYGFLLLLMYNGERGKQSKVFNYLAYPGHLIVIYVLRLLIVGGR